ncbi:MAG: ATP-grasp domain-containing protein [Candidatus Obscuribacterales bacterium]
MDLFLSPRHNQSSAAIESAAKEVGWNVHRLTNWRVPESYHASASGITAYGEPLFVAAIADALELALIEPTFSWLSNLPAKYLKRKVELTTLGEARRLNLKTFAKPADDKCFAAKVYESGAAIEASQLLPETSPVIVSDVVDWELECRYFVLERKVMCSSPYSFDGELIDDSFVEADNSANERSIFIESLLEDETVPLPPACVVDIGLIRGKGWAVVEANPAFGAGIYQCEPARVLPVLARSLVLRRDLSPSDHPWVLERTE